MHPPLRPYCCQGRTNHPLAFGVEGKVVDPTSNLGQWDFLGQKQGTLPAILGLSCDKANAPRMNIATQNTTCLFMQVPLFRNASPYCLSEIKVAAELEAENRIHIDLGVSPRLSSGGRHFAAPVFEFLFGNHHIDSPFSDVQPDLIASPNKPNGPPIADSEETCRMMVPNAIPLMSASEMRTMSLTPARASFAGIGRYPTEP